MADNPQQPEDKKKKTEPINIKSGDKKSDTTRIDLSSAKPPPSITDKDKLPPDADDYFKRSTMRIDTPSTNDETTKLDVASAKDETTKLDMASAKDETTKLEVPGKDDTTKLEVPSSTDKGKTSKIDINEASKSEDEIFKSKTIPVGVPTPPPRPTGPAKPKTIQFKRPAAAKPAPGESIIVSPEDTADATEQARKSETARIDLSSEDANRPATRPKTIRIKRPDGTSGKKALTITRPDGEAADEAVPQVAPVVEGIEESEDGADALSSAVALIALIVVGVLLYVLLAQTLAPTLSFPGRI